MRLGILTSHPIQYQASWFRELAKHVELQVFYAHRQTAAEQGKAGFGVAFDWDLDLLSGYRYRFLNNVSPTPSVDFSSGCDTPEITDIIQKARNHFDGFVVAGWYLKSYLQAVQACRAVGLPILARGDSQLRTPRSLARRLGMEVWQRRLLRKFDGFLSVGRRHSEYLQHFGVPRGKIFFAPHSVDNDWFGTRAAKARITRFEMRREWGAGESDIVALFVGKLIPKKRPMDLLAALVKLREAGGWQPNDVGSRAWSAATDHPAAAHHGVIAVVVGAGELDNELRQIAARERLRVHFAGFKNQTELPRYYASADALVLPSDSETWGLVVNEAMASGLPTIVSTEVGCGPDLIEDGKTGFVFPIGDPLALANCLTKLAVRLASGYDFARALAAKMQTYSPETAANNTLQAIETLTAYRPRPDIVSAAS